MTELILCGCGGKMGAAVRNFAEGRQDCKIVAGVDIAGGDQAGFPVYPSLDQVKERVLQQTGVELEMEVRVLR